MYKFFNENPSNEEVESFLKEKGEFALKLYGGGHIGKNAFADNFFKENKLNWGHIYDLCWQRNIDQADVINESWQLVAFCDDIKLIRKYFERNSESKEATSALDNMKQKRTGRTPLHYAAWSGNLEAVKFLFPKFKKSQNAPFGHPIHYAALAGADDVMQYLKDQGEDVNKTYPDTEATLIHLALVSKNIKAVEKAVALGVNPAQKDKKGQSPLDLVAVMLKDEPENKQLQEIKNYLQNISPTRNVHNCRIM